MRIRFCFDFISPYAYLGWHRLRQVGKERELEVEAVPVLFAALLDHHGLRGPAEIAAKRRYIFKDALRSASVLKVSLAPPPTHPFRPLLALRAAGALEGEVQARFIDGLFAVAWGGERHAEGGLEASAVVSRVAESVGLEGPQLIAAAGEQTAKDRLRQDTEAAIAAGVFGVPSMLVRGEVFWGLDSVPHLLRHLDGEDPVDDGALAQWEGLLASATRPGSTVTS